MSSSWALEEVLSEETDLGKKVCENLVKLIDKEQCTLPFIARYRKNQTNDISLEKLRKVFDSLSQLKDVQKKIDSALVKIEKAGSLTEDVKASLKDARSTDEIEYLTAPFKGTGGKRTLAGKACQLGLDSYAKEIMNGNTVNLRITIADDNGKPLSSKDIRQGIQHVMADMLSKDSEVITAMRTQFKRCDARLVTSKKVAKAAAKNGKSESKAAKPKRNDSHKYEQYYDFSVGVRNVRSHQILAINRAESQKYLTVKLTVPDSLENFYFSVCKKRWPIVDKQSKKLFNDAIADSYKRLLLPMLTRQCRSELKLIAEMSSVDTFGDNLKGLLLQPPCRGKTILAVDPGFTNGCKLAVISARGEVLDTATLYLHTHVRKAAETERLVQLTKHHNCSILALGNGTACRETEAIISECIGKGVFNPLQVKYCIVNEDGSSVYSVSKLGEEELPNLDHNHRSAVSIARRLQNPLVELVKIEPHHIGVGMYQHDIAEGKLKARLDSILSECVSFVGVEVNTASEHILSHVSGLNKLKAKAILKERERIGGMFVCREQLLNVKGLGAKSFEQCAGFITVRPLPDGKGSIQTTPKGVNGRKKAKLSFSTNSLDQTMVHPSSYPVAERFLEKLNLDVEDVGTVDAIDSVKQWAHRSRDNMSTVASELNTDTGTLQLIVEAFQQTLSYDIRDHMTKPLFKSGKTSIESLRTGDLMTGVVRNVVDFGAFIDIGVHQNGLMHISGMGGKKLALGNQVQVKIKNIDLSRERIGLQLVTVL